MDNMMWIFVYYSGILCDDLIGFKFKTSCFNNSLSTKEYCDGDLCA